MKILQKTGTYLENKIKLNIKIAFILLVIGLITLPFFGLGIIFIAISIYFFAESSPYKSGQSGEKLVTDTLQSLPDTYYLVNDVNLSNSYGNIDHVVLGNNGIFIIETKNFEGEIRCNEDMWYQYKDTWKIPDECEIKSPSKQVKRNAVKLKQFIESNNIFKKQLRIWVEGIIVFTHYNVSLNLNNPTVPVLKIDELNDYILNKKSRLVFSQDELRKIGGILLRQVVED